MAALSYFAIEVPFKWDLASGKMKFKVIAMAQHATSFPEYACAGVTLSINLGQLTRLYNADGSPRPGLTTAAFTGSIEGYVDIQPDPLVATYQLMCNEPATSIGGGSTPFQVVGPVTPPPGSKTITGVTVRYSDGSQYVDAGTKPVASVTIRYTDGSQVVA